jgi:hypothetical protein
MVRDSESHNCSKRLLQETMQPGAEKLMHVC